MRTLYAAGSSAQAPTEQAQTFLIRREIVDAQAHTSNTSLDIHP